MSGYESRVDTTFDDFLRSVSADPEVKPPQPALQAVSGVRIHAPIVNIRIRRVLDRKCRFLGDSHALSTPEFPRFGKPDLLRQFPRCFYGA